MGPLRVLLLVLLALHVTAAFSQEDPARLDSILPLLDPSVKDTNQLDMLIMVAESWATSKRAFPYLERLDTLSRTLLKDPDPDVRRRARHARGAFNFFTGYHAKFARNIPLALTSFHAALNDFSVYNEQHAMGECHDALGVMLRAAGEPDLAGNAFRSELTLGRAIQHSKLQVQALVHLAATAMDLEEFAAATAFLDSCNADTPEDSSMVLNERARLLVLRKEPDQAIATLEQSLGIARRADNPWDQLPVLAPLARTLFAIGSFKQSGGVAKACIKVAIEVGDETAQCICLVLAGKAAWAAGDLHNAERSFVRALDLAEENDNIGISREMGDEGSMVSAAHELKNLYTKQGRTTDALVMTELWALLKDSVQHMSGQEELIALQFKQQLVLDSITHEAEKQHTELVHEQRITKERELRYALLISGAFLLVIVLAVWSRMRSMAKTNAIILAAQQELVESERQREAEIVRTGIASDLHDELGSELTKITLHGSEAVRTLRNDPDIASEHLERMKGLSRSIGNSLNDIVWAVDPEHDTLHGLIDHAREFANRMTEDTGIELVLNMDHTESDRPIDPATKRDLFLVLKEALNNALKHAEATRIELSIIGTKKELTLYIQDNGKGRNGQVKDRVGNGTANMERRARRLGAILTVHSSPSAGTKVQLTLPWS